MKRILLLTKCVRRRAQRQAASALLVLAGVGLALAGCDDLIEPDISNQSVSLLTPAANSRSTTVVQRFEWGAISSARTYRIQIARPSFTSGMRLVLDSVVRQPSVTKSLAPGTYEWRVQALNAGYATGFSLRTLGVDSTGSLINQLVQLNQPASGYLTNATTLTLSWDKLPMAQQYRLWISPNPRGGALAPLDSTVGTATTVLLRPARLSQVYQWKVTALNATTRVVSATRTFEVDVTPPSAPTLVVPTAGASFLTLPITLSWTRSGTDISQDSVFIYRADQTTLFTGFPRLASAPGLTLAANSSPLITGTYYWAVRSMDRAGNWGPVTAKRAFVLQ